MVNLVCAVVKVRTAGAEAERGESARRSTSREGGKPSEKEHTISGDNSERDPPVPIPNTEVKPLSADGTWLATARESKTSPDSKRELERQRCFSNNLYSSVAQWQSTRLLTELL